MSIDDDVWGARLKGVLEREVDRLCPDVADAPHRDAVLLPTGVPAGLPAGLPQGLPTGAPAESAAPRRNGRRWAPLAAAAAVLVASSAGVAVGVLARRSPEQAPAAVPSVASTSGAAVVTSQTPATLASKTDPSSSAADGHRTAAVAVYWVGGPAGRRNLYREFVAQTPGVANAVTVMLTSRPVDPDLTSVWRPGRVSGASVAGPSGDATVTLDLSSSAFTASGVDAEQARLAVQQLVYTATAAAPGSTTLRLTVDGRTGYRAWDTLTLPAQIRRDPWARSSIWIINPQHGDTLPAGTVTVSGSGWAFEGVVSWELSSVASNGALRSLRHGTVMTRGDGIPADFTVRLPIASPGHYRITAWEEDMSDGESGYGPRLNVDTKDFVVR